MHLAAAVELGRKNELFLRSHRSGPLPMLAKCTVCCCLLRMASWHVQWSTDRKRPCGHKVYVVHLVMDSLSPNNAW